MIPIRPATRSDQVSRRLSGYKKKVGFRIRVVVSRNLLSATEWRLKGNVRARIRVPNGALLGISIAWCVCTQG